MNILYLTMNPNRQSTTMPTEEWFRLLPAKGLQPTLVTREIGDFAEWTQNQGHAVYQDSLPLPTKRWPIPFLRSAHALKKIIKRHHIELIHCNEQDIYPIGNWIAKRSNLPIVVSIHFTMQRDYCKWAFSGDRCPDRIFFTSNGNRDACKKGIEGVIPVEKQRILYNGLNLDRLSPSSSRRDQFRSELVDRDGISIGVACALRPRKQLEHLFQAASQKCVIKRTKVCDRQAHRSKVTRLMQKNLKHTADGFWEIDC